MYVHTVFMFTYNSTELEHTSALSNWTELNWSKQIINWNALQ